MLRRPRERALAAGATLNTNAGSAPTLGHLGYALAVDAGTTFNAGTLQLVVVTFSARRLVTYDGHHLWRRADFSTKSLMTVTPGDSHSGLGYTPGTVTITLWRPH